MRQIIPIIAVLCTGLALGVLATAVALSHRNAPPPLCEPLPELDLEVAAAEIADLRQSRGTILAGTLLASAESPDDFSLALARQTGVEPPSVAARTQLVGQLRRSAEDYDHQANTFEQQQQYSQADELRHLSQETRRVARSLAHEEQANRDVSSSESRR